MQIFLYIILLTLLLPVPLFAKTNEEAISYYELALTEMQYVKGASLFEEALGDSPSPVTIITEEEIKRFGWLNLRDVLEYQPSFYLIQDVNERVIAHRGIYRTITSYLSFLENGIPLNSPGYRNFILDDSYSLLGIKRIEVARGGAASLYGEAGFTGVVNLERDYSSAKARLEASLNSRSGEQAGFLFAHDLPLGFKLQALLHYKDEPALPQPRPRNHSLQFELSKEWISFYYLHFLNRYQTPRSQNGALLTSEDREPFGSYERASFDILGARFERSFGNWSFSLKPYLQVFDVHTPQIRTAHSEGLFTAQDIKLLSQGVYLEGLAKRELKQGSFLLGFKLGKEDYKRTRIKTFNGTFSEVSYPSKEEDMYALYAQLKYYLLANLILNAGLRYDHYEAFGGELSPRLALIFSPIQSLNFLLSYTHSFQAPPFLYRQTNIAGYGSERGLKTESLDTYTLSAIYQPAPNQFLQFSLYQEKAKDLIAYDQERKLYLNSGKMSLQGFEGEWKYLGESLLSFLNYSYYRVSSSEGIWPGSGKDVYYIPRHMLKGGISYRLPVYPEIYASPQVRWYSKARTKSLDYIPSYAVWDLNFLLRYKEWEGMLKIENLFDKRYERGGILPPVPFAKRTVWFKLERKF